MAVREGRSPRMVEDKRRRCGEPAQAGAVYEGLGDLDGVIAGSDEAQRLAPAGVVARRGRDRIGQRGRSPRSSI
jgi:hypothetical protein